jgi:TldD protein
MPRMRNTYMLPGPHTREEIIGSVKKGLYAESFTNGEVFIGAGDFTFYVKSGNLIEDGKLTRPVKDVNIIGNGPKVLKDIVMVADDFKMDDGGWTCGKNGQGVPVSLGLPTVKVSKITVGGVKA